MSAKETAHNVLELAKATPGAIKATPGAMRRAYKRITPQDKKFIRKNAAIGFTLAVAGGLVTGTARAFKAAQQ